MPATGTRHGAAVRCSRCIVRRSGTLTLRHGPASVTSLRPGGVSSAQEKGEYSPTRYLGHVYFYNVHSSALL